MPRVSRVLARGRRAAASVTDDRWVIRRPTGETVRIGFRDVRELLVVYTGPARLQTYEGHERPAGAASLASVTVQRAKLYVPIVGDYRPVPGDVATCIHAPHDPQLVGMSVQVTQEAPYKSTATAYRIYVDDVVGDDVPPPGEGVAGA